MEFGARELLIALGALVILAILIDGVRRARNARYDRIRMSRRKQPIFDEHESDEFGSELPSGGARVVSYRDEQDSEEVRQAIRRAAEANKPKLSISTKNKPEQTSLGLNDPVPVLMDPVADRDNQSSRKDVTKKSPQKFQQGGQAVGTHSKPGAKDLPASPHSAEKPTTPGKANPGAVIVFHLMARKGRVFAGSALLESLLDQGMRYGSMKIFHRHSETDGSGPVLFSLANGVEPGTFDLDAMAGFNTPGVSFFIALDKLERPSEAFATMLDTIATLVEKLDGELKDETRSAVTRQTVEHYWQWVKEFERRTLSESI